ncbi:hypothetical protein [Humibacter antri]
MKSSVFAASTPRWTPAEVAATLASPSWDDRAMAEVADGRTISDAEAEGADAVRR